MLHFMTLPLMPFGPSSRTWLATADLKTLFANYHALNIPLTTMAESCNWNYRIKLELKRDNLFYRNCLPFFLSVCEYLVSFVFAHGASQLRRVINYKFLMSRLRRTQPHCSYKDVDFNCEQWEGGSSRTRIWGGIEASQIRNQAEPLMIMNSCGCGS